MADEETTPHVAYLTSRYPALSHTFILREVEALRRLGFTVSTATIRQSDPTHLLGPEERAEDAATFRVLDTARNPLRLLAAQAALLRHPGRYAATLALALRTHRPGLRGFVWQIFYFLEATVLARHLGQIGADRLHCHFADAPCTVAMLASALTGLPFSFTLHGPSDLMQPESWQLGEKIARADFVSCISHFARSQCMLFSQPADWPKLRVVHCGVRPDRYGPPDQKGNDANRIDLVFVGRLAPVKGLRVLIDALVAARGANPHLHLTLIGDGPDRAALESLARPLERSVGLAGALSQAEVADALKTADIFVLPSFAEGVPVVLMEAMATGLPVIATQVAGVSELVTHGETGCLVPPGDAESLREAIVDLAADPARRRAMGQRGRQAVEDGFDADREGARIAALFAGTGGEAVRPEPYAPPAA